MQKFHERLFKESGRKSTSTAKRSLAAAVPMKLRYLLGIFDLHCYPFFKPFLSFQALFWRSLSFGYFRLLQHLCLRLFGA
jgi:hypothetical protein